MTQWVICKQEVVHLSHEARPKLGYTVVDGLPLFNTPEDAQAKLKEMDLPIGWVYSKLSQLFPNLKE